MEPKWRDLKAGEIIQEGDEVDACADSWRDDPVWKPAANIGEPACDPSFPSHRRYRRRVPDSQALYWTREAYYRGQSGFPPIPEQEEEFLFIGGPWDGQLKRGLRRTNIGPLRWNVPVPPDRTSRDSREWRQLEVCQYVEVFPGIMRDATIQGSIVEAVTTVMHDRIFAWRDPALTDEHSYCYAEDLPRGSPPVKIYWRFRDSDTRQWFYIHENREYILTGRICRCWRPGEVA